MKFQPSLFSHMFAYSVCLQTEDIPRRIRMSEFLNTKYRHDFHDFNAPPFQEVNNLQRKINSKYNSYYCISIRIFPFQNIIESMYVPSVPQRVVRLLLGACVDQPKSDILMIPYFLKYRFILIDYEHLGNQLENLLIVTSQLSRFSGLISL